jgi:hypothetical protein
MERIKDLKNCDVNHSNMLNESTHVFRKSTNKGFAKASSPDKFIQLEDGGEAIMQELKFTAALD